MFGSRFLLCCIIFIWRSCWRVTTWRCLHLLWEVAQRHLALGALPTWFENNLVTLSVKFNWESWPSPVAFFIARKRITCIINAVGWKIFSRMINIEMSKVYGSSPKKVWSVWATMARCWQGLLTQGRQIAPNNAIPWISNTTNKWKRLEMDPQRRSSSLSRGQSRQSSRKTLRILLIINPWIFFALFEG